MINGDHSQLKDPLYSKSKDKTDSSLENNLDINDNNYQRRKSVTLEVENQLKVSHNGSNVANGRRMSANLLHPEDTLKPPEKPHMERLRKNLKSRGNHFFNDGKRRVDYVLVHMKGNQIKTNDESAAAQARSIFEVTVFQINYLVAFLIIFCVNSIVCLTTGVSVQVLRKINDTKR